MAENKPYTTQLQAGLGLVNETKTLLDLWSPGMSAVQLYQIALESGRFPTVTARRLRNIVVSNTSVEAVAFNTCYDAAAEWVAVGQADVGFDLNSGSQLRIDHFL